MNQNRLLRTDIDESRGALANFCTLGEVGNSELGGRYRGGSFVSHSYLFCSRAPLPNVSIILHFLVNLDFLVTLKKVKSR